jgi:DNA (cytosine-5)-methyltransferase 1
VAGKRQGFNDTRGSLFFEIARIAKEKRPSILFLENVKGLLSHDKGQTFLTIIRTLDEMGYNVQWQIINSKYFVPQNRERVFIVGNLREKRQRKIFPIGNHDTKIKRGTKKMRGLVNNKGVLKFVENCTTLDANYFKGLDNHGQRTMIVIPVLTPDRIKKRQNGRRFKTNGEESFTLTAQDKHGIFDGIRIRRLTPLECERLQGFPDNWTKGISDTQRYKCVGNAVTVPVVEFIAKELFN